MRVKFWIQAALQNGLVVVGGSVGYGVMMTLTGAIENVERMLGIMMMFLLLFGAGMGIVIGLNLWKLNLPLALSFGSSRKEAFWGLQWYHLIYNGVILAATMVLCVLCGATAPLSLGLLLPVSVALLLLSTAASTIFGIVGVKYGKTVVIIISVVIGILLAGSIMAVVTLFLIQDAVGLNLTNWIIWGLPVVGVVLYGLSLIAEHKMVYRFAVKL